jgi:hypothetical protein
MKTNTVRPSTPATRLAGGMGAVAAKQGALATLRRMVLANLLFEDLFYIDGENIIDQIATLIPELTGAEICELAIEAKTKQKLRHIPLMLAVQMLKHEHLKVRVATLLPKIIRRPDDMAETISLYRKVNGHASFKKLPHQLKKGLAACFEKFDAYQFAKWAQNNQSISLRDVMFLVHPKPSQDRVELYRQIADKTLPAANTWEVAISGGENKKETWERLIETKKLGALAFLRNLRNISKECDDDTIRKAFDQINPQWLLPMNYFSACKHNPQWQLEIEKLMFRSYEKIEKLPGHTVMVVDVSGSMRGNVSAKSEVSRYEAGSVMAMIALEMCQHVSVYVTAGDDGDQKHETRKIDSCRGFSLIERILKSVYVMGGGGIFTRQCLEYINTKEKNVERIIIFSDSQDCDQKNKIPKPFGKYNYIVDISSEKHGINYKGVWTSEISGFSENFLNFIAASENIELPSTEDNSEPKNNFNQQ